MRNKVLSYIRGFLLISLLVLSLPFDLFAENGARDSYFGFNFGMSDKDAKNFINNRGKIILENDVDSKDIRTILFDGAVDEIYPNMPNKQTRLEFYNTKLMSSSLIFNSLDGNEFIDIQTQVLTQIVNLYGKPSASDSMLSYRIWTWYLEDIKLVVSSNRDKGTIQVEYTYKPVVDYKVQKELETKRKGEFRNPSDQMFKDGNYSSTGGPGIKSNPLGR